MQHCRQAVHLTGTGAGPTGWPAGAGWPCLLGLVLGSLLALRWPSPSRLRLVPWPGSPELCPLPLGFKTAPPSLSVSLMPVLAGLLDIPGPGQAAHEGVRTGTSAC